MADRELRLKIGAAVDASFNQVLADVVEQSKKANRQIAADKRAAKDEAVRMSKEGARAETEARRNAAMEARAISREVNAQIKAEDNAVLTAKKQRLKEEEQQERKMAKLRKEMAAEQRKDAIAAERASKKASDTAAANHKKTMDYWKSSITGGVTKGLGIAAGLGYGAVRMASGAAQALGVDIDPSSQLSKSVHRQSLANEVTMQGYIGSGKGPAGSSSMVDREELTSEARKVGNATGTSTEDILEGLNKFTQMTGDLQTARETMLDIGKVAKANGASFTDMMEAASNISIAMGDVDNKGAHVASVMRTIAGQGHLGAVTMKEMASQIGKLTSQSHFFQIDPMSAKTLSKAGVTDEIGQNIAVMGAMAQIARRSGGRISGQQATQSSMAFMADMASPTQVKKMAAAGLNVYTDPTHSKVRDPLQMMLEVARKSQTEKGLNLDVINSVFGKKQSRAVMVGMASMYDEEIKKASGTAQEKEQKAIEAVTAEFQNFLAVTQQTGEIEMKLAKAMETAESKSIVMNNNLGAVADSLRDTLLPALDAVGPALVEFTATMVDKLADILGVDSGQEKKTYKQIRGVSDANGVAKALLEKTDFNRAHPESTPLGYRVKTTEMTPAQQKEIYGTYEAGQKENSRLAGTIAEIGNKGSGLLGRGKKYKDMSPQELQSEIDSVPGDANAKKYQQAVAQQKQLEDNLKELAATIAELNLWQRQGVLKVHIVTDSTKQPPGANQPPNKSTQPVDASTE